MKTLLRTVIAFILFVTYSSANATTATDLAGLLNGVKSMRANFTQTIMDNHDKAIQKSYGKMAMQRPGKFRWQVTKPIPQLIVANDDKIWIYDADLQQVTIRKLDKAAGETPALLLSHINGNLENEFAVQEVNKNQPSWRWFVLTPKKTDSMFGNVEMGFQGNQIHQMRLKDNLGHATVIDFQNIETNVNLATTMFVFKAPANADVIDETRKKG